MQHTRNLCRINNISFYWLRLFYVIGKNQRLTSLIPTILKDLKKNNNLQIKNQLIYNDYVPVEKVSKTILYCIVHSPPSGIYNIGSGKSINYKEIADILKKQLKIDYDYKIFNFKQINTFKKVNFWSDNKKYNKFFKAIKTRDISYYIGKMADYYNG